MSQENVEMVWAAFERWNAGEEMDFESIHPEAEITSRLSFVQDEPYRGHEGVRQWRRDIYEQFTEWRLDVDEVRDIDGDRYLAPGRVHLQGRGSGVEFDQPLTWIFELRDGMFFKMSVYATKAEALAAVGLGVAAERGGGESP